MKISAVLGMILFLAAASVASAATEKISAGPFDVMKQKRKDPKTAINKDQQILNMDN
jgi:hypothetical protein